MSENDFSFSAHFSSIFDNKKKKTNPLIKFARDLVTISSPFVWRYSKRKPSEHKKLRTFTIGNTDIKSDKNTLRSAKTKLYEIILFTHNGLQPFIGLSTFRGK